MGGAVAVILIKERHIVDAFVNAHATSAASARFPSDVGADQDGVGWRRLRTRAVVRESTPGSGQYYVDVEVWEAVRRMRHRIILVIGLLVLAAAMFGLFATTQAR